MATRIGRGRICVTLFNSPTRKTPCWTQRSPSWTLPPRQLPAPATSFIVCTTTWTLSKPLSYYLCYLFCALFTHLYVYIFHLYWTLYCTIKCFLYDCAFVTFIIKGYLTWLDIDILYTSRVMADFVSIFVAMATRVGLFTIWMTSIW